MKNITEKICVILPYLAASAAIMIVLSTLMMMNHGADLTDEGYYLNWISNPWIYKYYTSQFGYMYHPLFTAVGGSLRYLRESSLLISFALSWLLCFNILRLKLPDTTPINLALLSVCLALPSLFTLTIAGRWVPTPSYNSLNFQGCVITMLGVVISTRNITFTSRVFGAILIGLGGWVVFMAKPSTALILVVTCLIYICSSIKHNKLVTAIASMTAICLLLVSAMMIDHSPLQFLQRLQGGVKLMHTLAAGHGLGSLLRWDPLKIKTSHLSYFFILSGLSYFAFEWSSSNQSLAKKTTIIFSCLLLAYSMYVALLSPAKMAYAPKYHTLAITSLALGFLLHQLKQMHTSILKHKHRGLFILLIIIPYAYAAGSGNNYWFTASGAIIFLLLGTILLMPKAHDKYIQLALFSSAVTAFAAYGITSASNTPYRQPEAVKLQKSIIKDPATQEDLFVSSETAKYIAALKNVLFLNQFKTGTPIIDLTGHHPGSLYYVGAKAIGQAWMIGGYKGSNQLATLTLQQFGCEELASAWLITEPTGNRAIADTALTDIGLKLDSEHYLEIGRVNSQTVFDIRQNSPRSYEQIIYKPIAENKQYQHCDRARKSKLASY